MTLAACRISGLEVDDEEGLAAGELLKVFPLSLHARQDRGRVVADNGKAYELARPRNVLNGEYRPDPDVELLQGKDRGQRQAHQETFPSGEVVHSADLCAGQARAARRGA